MPSIVDHDMPFRIAPAAGWLKSYYGARAAFSVAWVGLAFALGASHPQAAAALLVAYPAWDAAANYVDASSNGGLRRNPSQALNLAASALATVAVAIALARSMNAVLAVFGAWAFFAGVFQLVTGVRRWRSVGVQWAMILSGAQSALAGVIFVVRAGGPATPGITDIAPYAAFGAFYFLVSALWLLVSDLRRSPARA